MFLQSLWVVSVGSLLLRPLSLLRVSTLVISSETERKDAGIVLSRTIKRLHDVFHTGDMPLNCVPHRTPPQFMVELFNAVADSNGITRIPKILDGNVVRSFEDKDHYDQTFHFFNLSSFGNNEKMIKAEFRVFRRKQTFLPQNLLGHLFYKLDLYELLDSRIKPWRGNFITSRLLPLYTQGWEVFNVTDTVSKWIHDSKTNNGILGVASLPSGELLEYALPDSHTSKWDEKNAYLVIFSDDKRKMSDSLLSKGLRTSPDKATAVTLNKAKNSESLTPASRSRRARAAPYHPSQNPITCQRVPLYVDFEKIGWSGWIISPRGYNAFHCSGSCPFPLGESLRPTNHATVQSIVNALKLSKEVERPCCVPDKLQSISLLYFDDEENVVLKQYEDMVALSCGCH